MWSRPNGQWICELKCNPIAKVRHVLVLQVFAKAWVLQFRAVHTAFGLRRPNALRSSLFELRLGFPWQHQTFQKKSARKSAGSICARCQHEPCSNLGKQPCMIHSNKPSGNKRNSRAWSYRNIIIFGEPNYQWLPVNVVCCTSKVT